MTKKSGTILKFVRSSRVYVQSETELEPTGQKTGLDDTARKPKYPENKQQSNENAGQDGMNFKQNGFKNCPQKPKVGLIASNPYETELIERSAFSNRR